MRKRKAKRYISLLLALTMAISMASGGWIVTARAEETQGTETTVPGNDAEDSKETGNLSTPVVSTNPEKPSDPVVSMNPEKNNSSTTDPVAQVQKMIDALPDGDEITVDNAKDVEAQLAAIDEAKAALSDEEMDALDVTRYMAAVAALNALNGQEGAGEPAPTNVDSVTYDKVSTSYNATYYIYANGTPLILKAGTGGSSYTVIYVDADGDGNVTEMDIWEPGSLNAGTKGNRYSNLYIYGGSNTDTVTGNTSVTMLGGFATAIYGGSRKGTVSGDTKVAVHGGTVSSVYGAGHSEVSSVIGDTVVTMDGGTVGNSVFGGGSDGTVGGSTSVTVTGGTVTNHVCGGSSGTSGGTTGAIGGSTSVSVGGSASVGDVVGGSYYSGKVTGSTSVAISGGTVGAPGYSASSFAICGSGYEAAVEKDATISITGGIVEGHVFGTSNRPLVAVGGNVLTTVKDATVTGSVRARGVANVGGTVSLTVGGAAKIGNAAETTFYNGIILNSKSVTAGIDRFEIAPDLTEDAKLYLYLPSDYTCTGEPVVATAGVQNDISYMELKGAAKVPGGMGLHLDGTNIYIGQPKVVGPTPVADVTIDGTTTTYRYAEDGTYKTAAAAFKAAWEAAQGADSATVTLLADVTIDRALSVEEGDNITFEGGEHTLSKTDIWSIIGVSGGELTINSGTIGYTDPPESSSQYCVWVYGGKVTINGGTISGTQGVYIHESAKGTVDINGGVITGTGSTGHGISAKGGTVTISGGTISGVGDITKSGYGYGIHASGSSTVIINGGEISGNGKSTGGVFASDKSTVTINNGTVAGTGESPNGVSVNGNSTVTINGGTISGISTKSNGYGYGVYIDEGTLTVGGGRINGNMYGMYIRGGTVSVSGGTFTGRDRSVYSLTTGRTAVGDLLAEGCAYYKGETVSVENRIPDDKMTETSLTAKDDYGTVTVAKDVTLITSVATVITSEGATTYGYAEGGTYTTAADALQAAWAAAQKADSATVTLLMDVELKSPLLVTKGNDITLLGRGHTISGTMEKDSGMINVTGGTLKIYEATVRNNATSRSCGVGAIGGTVYLYSGTVSGYYGIYVGAGAVLYMNGGQVNGDQYIGVVVYDGTAYISDGAITGKDSGVEVGRGSIGGRAYISGNVTVTSTTYLTASGVFAAKNASVEISGGTFTSQAGGNGLYALDGSNVTLTGGTFTGSYSVCRESNSSLTVGDLLADDYWYYNSNNMGVPQKTVESDALKSADGYGTVTVKRNTLRITQPPEDKTVTYGTDIGLTVKAEALDGTGTLGYQWYQVKGDGTVDSVANGTGAELTVSGLPVGKYTYYCDVTCGGLTVSSDTATVTVKKADPVCVPPSGLTVEYGSTLSTVKLVNSSTNTPGTWAWNDDDHVVKDFVGNNTYTATFTPADTNNYQTVDKISVTVQVVDTQDPTGTITLGTNQWNTLLNKVTFGKFFKNTQSVTITGTDNYRESVKIEYLLAASDQSREELEKADWIIYSSSISVEPGKYVIYARITDASGNAVVINSDGIVIYTESVAETGRVTYTYGENTDRMVKITLNGNTVRAVSVGDGELRRDVDYTVTDGRVTVKAAYLDTLNVGEYTLTVSYDPQGMETETVTDLKTPIDLVVEKAVITDISGTTDSVTAPAALAEVQSTVTAGSGYSAQIKWNCKEDTYGFNTSYTATLTLTPDGNHEFADDITGADGWTVTNTDGVLTLKKTFPATRLKKIINVKEPSNVTLNSHKENANAVIQTLPDKVKATLEVNGTVDLDIEWSCENYNAAPAAVNTFTWTVPASETDQRFDRNGISLTGTITVTNPKAKTVNISGQDTTVTYDGNEIGLARLFIIDKNAGVASYTVENGTGAGDVENGKLTVTRAGTFTVTVKTAAKGIYAPGEKSVTLTVNKGTGSGTVSIAGWTYGDTANTPVPASATNGTEDVEYKYESLDGTYDSAKAPAGAGSYRVIASFAETDLYQETTASAEFTIAKKEIEAKVTARDKTYDGNADAVVTAIVDTGIDGEKLTVSGLTGTFADANVGTNKTVAVHTDSLAYSGTANPANYVVNFPETVRADITAADMTADVAGYSGVYDGASHGITVTPSEKGASVQFGTEEGTYDKDEVAYTDAGTYTVYYQVTKDNYTTVTGSATVEIEKRPVTVTANSREKTYSETDPELTYTASGLVKGDAPKGKLSREEGEDAGVYAITQGTLTDADNPNYRITFRGADFTIQKAGQDAPSLTVVNESICGKGDGAINGLTTAMEISSGGESYVAVTDPEMSFAAGTYHVRYAADGNHNASSDTVVTVKTGRMLTVTFKADDTVVTREVEWDASLTDIPDIPAKAGYDQTAPYWDTDKFTHIRQDMTVTAVYTINTYSVTLPENTIGYVVGTEQDGTVEYDGSFTFTVSIGEGYSEAKDFAVMVNGETLTPDENGSYTISNIREDITVTVEGVADLTPPDVEVAIGDNKWNSFWNTVTFGLFFKETQSVAITAEDIGSGVGRVYYFLAAEELSKDEVKAISEWTEYTGTFNIDPDHAYIIYVKAVDNAGNTVYVNSGGVVLDAVAPVISGIENNGVYYGDTTFTAEDTCLDTVSVDGGEAALEDGRYVIPADNKEHTILVTDKAGNQTGYTVTVYKVYTVTYIADGKVVSTQRVGYGKDAQAPAIPEKDGYKQTAPVWDKDGKNITDDVIITAVYTADPAEPPVTEPSDPEPPATEPSEPEPPATNPTVPEPSEPEPPATNPTVPEPSDPESPATDSAVTEPSKPELPVQGSSETESTAAKPAASENKGPKTGDSTAVWPWFALIFASCAGMAGTAVHSSRKKKKAE